MRVAIGSIAKAVLDRVSIEVVSHVVSIGDVEARPDTSSVERLKRATARSAVRCADAASGREMLRAIESASREGHSLGGSVEVLAVGVPPGLGSHVSWDRKLDARLAGALMSVQSVKAVEIGAGLETSRMRGVDAQDAIVIEDGMITRPTNRAGGIEGGISNGENVVVRVYAKPIPTARRCLPTIDLETGETRESPFVRADVCVVPAVGVIAEAVVAWELARALLEKFGGDHMEEIETRVAEFIASIARRNRP
jgi:chorismate synthase